MSSPSGVAATTAGSPCGACKFLRRKCATDCVFAPYFSSEQGPARFAAIHKVFGASNVAKLLQHVPQRDRCEAVVTISYEAQARIRDPIYGCVGHIFALQQQVANLQAQLIQARAQLARNMASAAHRPTADNQYLWQTQFGFLPSQSCFYEGVNVPVTAVISGQEACLKEGGFSQQVSCSMKRRALEGDAGLGDLHDLAQKIMRS